MKEQKHIANEVINWIIKRECIFRAPLIGYLRTRTYVEARRTAMYCIRQMTDLTLDEIGSMFSGRHHTTVLHAINTADRHLAEKVMTEMINRRHEDGNASRGAQSPDASAASRSDEAAG